MRNKKFKFVHLFFAQNLGFNKILIEMICDKDNNFDIKEHLFVTTCKELYDLECKKCSIEYFTNPKHNNINMVNVYANRGEWLIVHSMPFCRAVLYIKRRFYKKILWRTWGHDVIVFNHPVKTYMKDMIDSPEKYSLAYLRFLIDWRKLVKESRFEKEYKKIIGQFKGVGIQNTIDAFNIKKNLGNIKMYKMPYSSRNDYTEVMSNIGRRKQDEVLHVMIGHSGFINDSHCDMLDCMKQYESQCIKLHFVLSYGDKDYIAYVIKYINQNWHGAVEIITDHMPHNKYAEFINNMDIIILNGDRSYALGNLSIALTYGKTIFLNRQGVLKEGLLAENIPFHYVDEIANMPFDEFSNMLSYKVDENSSLICQPYEKVVNMWKKIFDELA